MTATTRTEAALRWGVIGCGKIASDFVNALKSVPSARLEACAARALSGAEEFAAVHGFARAYGSYDEICADAAIDVVYIGTLHISHYEHALLALRHGKHVLVEKPMTINATQAEHVISVAREKKLFFMEGMWTRFFPATRYVRELLAAGAIGDVHHVNADIGFRFASDNARMWELALGGGGLLDIGIYPLAFVTMVFGHGAPERITATGRLSDGGVDVYGAVTLEYSGCRFGTIQYSCLAEFAETVTIIGTTGQIHIAPAAHRPTKVTLIRELADGTRKEQHSSFAPPEPHPQATAFHYGGSEGFFYEAEAVSQAILEHGRTEHPEYPLDESLALARIMDAVRKQLGVVYPADQ